MIAAEFIVYSFLLVVGCVFTRLEKKLEGIRERD